jgi:hypothetical protein
MTDSQFSQYPEPVADQRRDYLESTFGSDVVNVGLATDQPAANRRPLGLRVAHDRRRAERERQQADDLELVALAAQEDAEDQALAASLRRIQRGEKIPTGALSLTRRALIRRGYHRGSTADRLAQMVGRGEGWRGP